MMRCCKISPNLRSTSSTFKVLIICTSILLIWFIRTLHFSSSEIKEKLANQDNIKASIKYFPNSKLQSGHKNMTENNIHNGSVKSPISEKKPSTIHVLLD